MLFEQESSNLFAEDFVIIDLSSTNLKVRLMILSKSLTNVLVRLLFFHEISLANYEIIKV